MALRRLLLSLSLPLLFLTAAACGGTQGAVHLSWRAGDNDSDTVQLKLQRDDTYQTSVMVRNGTDGVLRDAQLRLRPTQDAVLGLGVGGTVTSMHTEMDGIDSVWRIGDLQPGQGMLVPIGLWFDVSPQLHSGALQLTIELSSPDMRTPLTSAPLKVEAS